MNCSKCYSSKTTEYKIKSGTKTATYVKCVSCGYSEIRGAENNPKFQADGLLVDDICSLIKEECFSLSRGAEILRIGLVEMRAFQMRYVRGEKD